MSQISLNISITSIKYQVSQSGETTET